MSRGRRCGRRLGRARPTPRSAAQRGAFDSARRLLLGLALASLVAVLPDLVNQTSGQLLLGSVGIGFLVASWLALYRTNISPLVVDLADAASLLVVSLAVSLVWEVPGVMLGSLWYRSLGASRRSVITRVTLYAVVVAGTAAVRAGAFSWNGSAAAISVVPLMAVTALVARRMGAMLVEHDCVAAVGAMESELSAAVVDEPDGSSLTAWSRASWRALCHVVPGVRIALVERRRGVWEVAMTAGTWKQPPVSLDAQSLAEVVPWEAPDGSTPGMVPVLDRAAGEACRWGAVPLLDSRGRYRLLVGIPFGIGPGLVAAITGALSRSELLMQYTRDHVALAARARADELTGLPNRLAFFETLAVLEQQHNRLSLVFLDLDGFKDVNDTHGHAVGDVVLREASARLRDACPSAAVCARLGGDEFAVLFAGAEAMRAEDVIRQAEVAVAAPMLTSVGMVSVGVSWGVASVEDGDTTELLARADAAMYRRKRSHRENLRLER